VQHFVSDDGEKWERVGQRCSAASGPYVVRVGDAYHIFYEKPRGVRFGHLSAGIGANLLTWSPEKVRSRRNTTGRRRTSAPNGNSVRGVPRRPRRLYFSARSDSCATPVLRAAPVSGCRGRLHRGAVIKAPRAVDFALAGALLAPISGRVDQGAAAEERRRVFMGWAFTNGIYRDRRMGVPAPKSEDEKRGRLPWEPVGSGPIFAPSDAADWKRALVYAMHVIKVEGRWPMY